MTPEEFATKVNEWSRGTMIAEHGTRSLEAAGALQAHYNGRGRGRARRRAPA
jgi:hypothetical protein